MCADAITRISLFARAYTLSLFLFVFFFSYSLFFVCVYVIVCFTLDVNCEERRRSFDVRRVYIREEELRRDKRGKERTMNVKELKKEKITYSFFSSSSFVYSRNDCMLYRLRIELVKVILYIVQLSHEIEEKNLLGKIYSEVTLKRSC